MSSSTARCWGVIGPRPRPATVTGSRRAAVRHPVRTSHLEAPGPVRPGNVAATGGIRPGLRVPRAQAHGRKERLQGVEGPLLVATIRPPRKPIDDHGIHAPERSGRGIEASRPSLLTVISPASASSTAEPGQLTAASGRLHNWHTPVPAHAWQSISRRQWRMRVLPTCLPVPLHVAQRWLPLHQGQVGEGSFTTIAAPR